jgi:hypothetical protein
LAICLLLSPWATNAAISRSRLVNRIGDPTTGAAVGFGGTTGPFSSQDDGAMDKQSSSFGVAAAMAAP